MRTPANMSSPSRPSSKRKKPATDPAVYLQLAGYYSRQGNFEKTIESLNERIQTEPNNPEAYYTLSTYYWDEAYRDFRLNDKQKMDYVLSGIDAVNKAVEIRPDYMEAIAYKNLLLRLQANLEKDPAKQQALLREADQLRDKATELRKQKAPASARATQGRLGGILRARLHPDPRPASPGANRSQPSRRTYPSKSAATRVEGPVLSEPAAIRVEGPLAVDGTAFFLVCFLRRLARWYLQTLVRERALRRVFARWLA